MLEFIHISAITSRRESVKTKTLALNTPTPGACTKLRPFSASQARRLICHAEVD